MEICESAPGVRQRSLEGPYRNGKADGRWQGWHPSGRPVGEAEMRAGQIRRVVAWYEDGTVALEGDMVAARISIFDPRGRRRLLSEVVNGQATARSRDEQGARPPR